MQVRPLTVVRGLPGAEITEQHVAGYLAKYATRATEAAGHLSTRLTESTVGLSADPTKHAGRLMAAALDERPESMRTSPGSVPTR
jgi:hypothetical protein